ncbi:hypothetical protein [Halostella sp. PRR32]|uniref:hypothetical protein n=1 Tax=Halostella sp. PRR32 TaxID=3098147 RepID=UPI002B1DDB52|nr:hypothetical protein [Halostella sp. PRR32]
MTDNEESMTGTDMREYVERAHTAVTESDDLSLRNTELRLVQPFLEALGWDVRLPEVEADVNVPDRDPVDYALRVDDRPAVFVDVVPCEDSLREADIDRLEVGMTAGGVDWGILTNGRSFVFLARNGDDVERLECRLDRFPSHEDAVSMYTKAAVESRRPAADRRIAAERIAKRREAVAETLTETLVAAADGAATDEIAAIVDGFVDDLLVALGPDDAAVNDGGAARPSKATAGNSADSTDGDPAATGRKDASPGDDGPTGSSPGDGRSASSATTEGGEYVVRVFDGRTSVGAVGTEDPVGAMANAIELLLDRYALDSRLTLPWRPDASDEKGRAVLARTPVHPNGTEMRSHRRLSNGYCLLATLDASSAKAVVRELAGQSGLRVMFQGDW